MRAWSGTRSSVSHFSLTLACARIEAACCCCGGGGGCALATCVLHAGSPPSAHRRPLPTDVDSACTVLEKIVGLTTITRMKLGNTDLPQLDKKSSAELSKLLQASQLS